MKVEPGSLAVPLINIDEFIVQSIGFASMRLTRISGCALISFLRSPNMSDLLGSPFNWFYPKTGLMVADESPISFR
jgi:hypothetical protein